MSKAPDTPKKALRIRLLGDFAVLEGDERKKLPPSKKTRALLAYLIVTAREQKRSRMCSLLWDVADDPRGALRWSLSKIRKIVNTDDVERLVADRETVEFVAHDAVIDIHTLRSVSRRLSEASLEELEDVAAVVGGELLEGLELTDFDSFQAWCVGRREEARRQHVALLRELVRRLEDDAERALPHARRLVQVEPMDDGAQISLLRLLAASGRRAEAEQQFDSAKRLFQELGSGKASALLTTFAAVEWGGARSVREPRVAPTTLIQPAGLVGRRDELARFGTTVQAVMDSQKSRILLLTGEPGVGKSRLLSALTDDVKRHGGSVLAGACFEAERDRPYGPWIDALRDTNSNETLVPLFAGQDVPEALTRDRMFAAVGETIAERARNAPIVLVIVDDVHWCDEASSSLLHFAARTSRDAPILFALAARDGELDDNDAMQRIVRTLRRDAVLEDVPVGPLSEKETTELVRDMAPDVEGIYGDCAGNPLFALELARAGKSGAMTVTELVRDRFARLSDECCDVLRWGAVLGHGFGVHRLAELTVLEDMMLADSLEALEKHALLVPQDNGSYHFAHDLVRQVVYGELSAPRRRLMHKRIATTLADKGDLDSERAAEIAHHASMGGDAPLATLSCIAAGRRCLKLFAPAEAYALSRRGLHYIDELDESLRLERKLELIEIGYAARPPQDPEEAAGTLEGLAERLLDLGNTKHARRAFNVLSYIRWETGDWREAERGMLAAERVSRGRNDVERALALAEAARCLVVLDRDLPHAEAMSLESVAVSDRLGVEEASVVDAAGMLRQHSGELDQAETLYLRARELAHDERDRWAEYQPLEHLVKLRLEQKRYDEALSLSEDLKVLAARFRQGSESPFAGALQGLCLCHVGRDGALDTLHEGIGALRAVDAKSRLAFILSRAAGLALERGEVDAALEHANEASAMASKLRHHSELALAQVMIVRAAKAADKAEIAEQTLAKLRETSLVGIAHDVREMVLLLVAAD